MGADDRGAHLACCPVWLPNARIKFVIVGACGGRKRCQQCCKVAVVAEGAIPRPTHASQHALGAHSCDARGQLLATDGGRVALTCSPCAACAQCQPCPPVHPATSPPTDMDAHHHRHDTTNAARAQRTNTQARALARRQRTTWCTAHHSSAAAAPCTMKHPNACCTQLPPLVGSKDTLW